MAVPAVPVPIWVLFWLIVTIALLLRGGYRRVERISLIQVALFTLMTVLAALVLMRMPEYFAWEDARGGLTFQLPAQGLGTAVAVFGITGVGATELFMYPYWCVEKGYARFIGPRDDSPAWVARARGWIRVMHLDITCSLAIYTLATIAFYLLGAGVLNRMGIIPAERDTVQVLSQIYTQTLGEWALWLFYAGAVVTLYGTIFASTAAHSRLFADAMRLAGVFEREDSRRRLQWRNRFLVALSVVPVIFYWFFEAPVQMVLAGGLAQAALLPLIGIAAVYLGHRHLPGVIRPSRGTTVALWAATAVMLGFALYYAGTRIF
jgi:Mn2+/Fe2+ NRAMP family transporter